MMRKCFIVLILSFIIVFEIISCAPKVKNGYSKERGFEGNISLSGAFALYPLAVVWSEDFKKIHPHVRFNISAGGAGKGIADVLTGMVDIGMVSRDLHEQEVKKGAVPIVVAKDAVICTINPGNPNYQAILKRGLSREELSDIFISRKFKTWKQIDPRFTADPINVYVRSDAAGAAETWAKFFGHKQEDLQGIGIFGDPGIAQAIKDDIHGIGFNNINYVYNLKTNKVFDRIDVVPLDLNKNGQIENEERFYHTLSELTEAVAAGRYPAPPSRELTFVTRHKTESLLLKEFISFVLQKQAQSQLLENGYVPLNETLIKEELNKL
ncbi:PstS family phosphate ABC transporter substrate-binding protein [Sphingobacterium sp.]|uniref:PstS family phosphate ABC transporter substrate-binding protein n=1 Tax=Sphingobacterium sp. TaxID=341027 RepID=UPI0028AA199B|nr:PstS family phosphate ABC transporter substrate-binding protein [Sphingobacterium sp.]